MIAYLPQDDVRFVKNVLVPVGDGTRLLALDLHVPDVPDWESTPQPLILECIPYRKDDSPPYSGQHEYFARHGFIGARLDCRGTGSSEGVSTDEYTEREQQDAVEAIAWLADQPWVRRQHRRDRRLLRRLHQRPDRHPPAAQPAHYHPDLLHRQPLHRRLPLPRRRRARRYPNPPLRCFDELQAPKKLLMGPWNHARPNVAIPGPRIDHLREIVRWCDHWLKGEENGVTAAKICCYVQVYDEPRADRTETTGYWRVEEELAPPGSTDLTLPLAGDGVLGESATEAGAGFDEYEYRPTVGLAGGTEFPSRLLPVVPTRPAAGSSHLPADETAFAPAGPASIYSLSPHDPPRQIAHDQLGDRTGLKTVTRDRMWVSPETEVQSDRLLEVWASNRDPADVSAVGQHLRRIERRDDVTRVDACYTLSSTESTFHLTIDLQVTISGAG